MQKLILTLLSFITLLVSCSKDNNTPKDYTAENEKEILTYINEHHLTAKKADKGFYYVIDKEGAGENPDSTDIVKVKIKGFYTNGDTLTNNNDKAIQLKLQKIIPGLAYGIPYFKKGGSGKLIIPSKLGYGSNTQYGVPGGSVLVFDINLLDIYKNVDTANDAEIKDYITEQKLKDTIKTNSGLYYIIDKEGLGKNPTSTDKVTVSYKGYYTNGTIFDQSVVSGATFDLTKMIKGWQEGIPYFKVGGSGKLIIPSRLAYGDKDYNSIPGGSVLVFDIKLISIN